MYKDPRNERSRHILGKDCKMLNRQIEIVDNRKNQNYLWFNDLVYGYIMLELGTKS